MAEYRPSSFFYVSMDRDGIEIHQRAILGQYPAIFTEQAWPIKDGFRGNFSCGARRAGSPERQDSSILPAQVSNHSAGFRSVRIVSSQSRKTNHKVVISVLKG